MRDYEVATGNSFKRSMDWGDMSPAEQRVEIAKDVRWLIARKKFSGQYMTYTQRPAVRHHPEEECRGCALGALMYAALHLSGSPWISEVYSDNVGRTCIRTALRDVFPGHQLGRIEAAFEGWGDCEHWRDSWDDPDDLIDAIMQNIIDHKGTFRPDIVYQRKS